MGQVAMRSIASNPADPHARPRKQAAATAPHIVHGEESSLLYAQGEESSVVSTTAYQPQPERRINPNEDCVVVVYLNFTTNIFTEKFRIAQRKINFSG